MKLGMRGLLGVGGSDSPCLRLVQGIKGTGRYWNMGSGCSGLKVPHKWFACLGQFCDSETYTLLSREYLVAGSKSDPGTQGECIVQIISDAVHKPGWRANPMCTITPMLTEKQLI